LLAKCKLMAYNIGPKTVVFPTVFVGKKGLRISR